MNFQRRRAVRLALFSCLAFTVAATFLHILVTAQNAQSAATQQTPAATATPMPSQSPLIQPVPAAPSSSPATSQQQQRRANGQTGNDEHLIINTDLITLTVTVTDPMGRYVSGLQKNAFAIFDENQPQEIEFFSDDDSPVSVGVIFDVSGSMSGEKVRRAREALRHFIETSHDHDEYFLIGFNQRAQLLLDRTNDGDAVLNKLTFVDTHGSTALYDATYLGVEKVTRGRHPKRAILIISDGQDNNSRYTFSEVRRLLRESDVVVYAVGINTGDPTSSLDAEGEGVLTELAAASGGHAFFPHSSAEMDEVFEKIAVELRHQYSIGYRPSNFVNDGHWHHIKIKVTPPRGLPRLSVRNKPGYYAVVNPR